MAAPTRQPSTGAPRRRACWCSRALQKLAASSIVAIRNALRKRRVMLAAKVSQTQVDASVHMPDDEQVTLDDVAEAEEQLPTSAAVLLLRDEIRRLDELVELSEAVTGGNEDRSAHGDDSRRVSGRRTGAAVHRIQGDPGARRERAASAVRLRFSRLHQWRRPARRAGAGVGDDGRCRAAASAGRLRVQRRQGPLSGVNGGGRRGHRPSRAMRHARARRHALESDAACTSGSVACRATASHGPSPLIYCATRTPSRRASGTC